MTGRLTIRSPAKVNLFLEVLGKRPDGYHELVTIMQEISLCDYLEIAERPNGITIRSDHPELPTDRRNLVYQAAELLKRRYQIKAGVRINITKHIPIGGGLGGGSSNAAYTLKGLNQLWKLGLAETELSLLARKLGSDVPFFISGQTALCKGRGEIVFRLALPPYFHYLIAWPGFAVPTGKIYQSLQKLCLTKPFDNTTIATSLERADLGRGRTNERNTSDIPLFNRLEKTALQLYPKLRAIKKGLVGCGLEKVLLCGSGACFLGIVKDRKEGDIITSRVYKRKILNAGRIFRAHTE